MKKLFRDKRGFISIYMILWMSVLIPFLLFVFIDVSHYVYEGIHLKAITDNAAASAVTRIKEDLVSEGVLEIDENQAEEVALNIIRNDLHLKNDFTPKSNSLLKEKPKIEVYVLNITSKDGYDFETPAGTVKIYNPSVVVYGKYPVKGLFYNNGVVIQRVGVSQVQFNNNQ
jgi:hypothetical protein